MAIGRQAAARRYGVHVRVVAQVAGPGMQSPHQRDPAADEPWVQSQCLSGLGRGLQEQGIKGLLVAAGQPAEGLREGEGAQEGRDRQQHMRLAFQPLLGLVIVAPGAMPVLTRVVAIVFKKKIVRSNRFQQPRLMRPAGCRAQEFLPGYWRT